MSDWVLGGRLRERLVGSGDGPADSVRVELRRTQGPALCSHPYQRTVPDVLGGLASPLADAGCAPFVARDLVATVPYSLCRSRSTSQPSGDRPVTAVRPRLLGSVTMSRTGRPRSCGQSDALFCRARSTFSAEWLRHSKGSATATLGRWRSRARSGRRCQPRDRMPAIWASARTIGSPDDHVTKVRAVALAATLSSTAIGRRDVHQVCHRCSKSSQRRPAGRRHKPRSISSTVTTQMLRSAASMARASEHVRIGFVLRELRTTFVSTMITIGPRSSLVGARQSRRSTPPTSTAAACSARRYFSSGRSLPRPRSPPLPRPIGHAWQRDRATARGFARPTA